MVFGLNWVYAQPWPHRLLSVLRYLNWLSVLFGPLLCWLAFGFDLPAALLMPATGLEVVLAAYGWICLFVGLVIFPCVTLGRALRRSPRALLSNHTKTVDVAAQLGYKPIGRGKHRRLARLPRNEIFQVDFTERTFAIPDLPAAWEGLTILHVSDLHFHGTPDLEFFKLVMDRCREWEPDLVALTGDVVDSARHYRWIVPVLGLLRWRIAAFAILGNHDSWRDVPLLRRRLRKLGMKVLDNRWEKIDVRGEPLIVAGHEGPWFQPEPDLSTCPAEGFRLLLSHTPDNIGWAQQHGFQLMLSGHNHGGQIRFPLIGSVYSPSIYGRRYDCGSHFEAPTLLHVSRGLSGQHPVRYNCRPEVTLLMLRRG
jgi:predicted MPP superfamily phosphohydrolase